MPTQSLSTLDIWREGLTDGNSIKTTRKKYLKLVHRLHLKKVAYFTELSTAISGVFRHFLHCCILGQVEKVNTDENRILRQLKTFRYSFRVKDIFTLKFYLYIFQCSNSILQ